MFDFTKDQIIYSIKLILVLIFSFIFCVNFNLPQPQWAFVSAMIVMNPLSSPTRSKAFYRFIGSLIGGITAILINVFFIQSQMEVMIVTCLFVLLGITLQILTSMYSYSYIFQLGGLTVLIVNVASLGNPVAVFEMASARIMEVAIGVTVATVINDLIFPQSYIPVVIHKIEGWVVEIEKWIHRSLSEEETGLKERQIIYSDLHAMNEMLTHLKFDQTIHKNIYRYATSIRKHMLVMLPMTSMLYEQKKHVSPDVNNIIQRVDDFFSSSPKDEIQYSSLVNELNSQVEHYNQKGDWQSFLNSNYLNRLKELCKMRIEITHLVSHIKDGKTNLGKEYHHVVPKNPTNLHADYGVLFLSLVPGVLSILICGFIWHETQWGAGSGFFLLGVFFSMIFSMVDDPIAGLKGSLKAIVGGLFFNAIISLYLLPRATTVETYIIILVCVILPFSLMTAKKPALGQMFIFFVANMAISSTYAPVNGDAVLEGILSNGLGVVVAIGTNKLTRVLSTEWMINRIVRLNREHLQSILQSRKNPNFWTNFNALTHRLSLLMPRMANSADEKIKSLNVLSETQIVFYMMVLKNHNKSFFKPLFEKMQSLLEKTDSSEPLSPSDDLIHELDSVIEKTIKFEDKAHNKRVLEYLLGLRINLLPEGPYFNQEALQ